MSVAYEHLGGNLHRHGGGLTHSHPHPGPHTHGSEHQHNDGDGHGHRHGLVELLADVIHNFGDAATAIPLGAAFALHSERAERWAGLAVVFAIFASAFVAGFEAIDRLIHPRAVEHLGALAAAGGIGYLGHWVAARIRIRAGRRLDSPALIADGNHARADAYVSLAVVASAAALALGWDVLDPLIGLAITAVIVRITWQSWLTVRS
jgi:cation diffusion facilitator family transporter